ncbi:AAA domain-containing protein [Lentinula guzmanii]|uniref:DNA helicase n=1 Tax=Lentinula guzmanii TaxID=2804957 RepID=A0AA38MWI3_9AGAR|nr:AAA domain-containing protein [Lentinula guzmanii]
MASSDSQLLAFIDRQKLLLSQERDAEIERSSLLLSNCGPKLLEQKGLALLGLGINEIKIGLGGKTLVELERPSAYHTNPIFPPHNLRTGDIARIEANAATKSKKPLTTDIKDTTVEGVVYKVSDTRIVLAVDSEDDLSLPERCRLVKLANSVTYDRMDRAIEQLEKTIKGEKDTRLTPLLKVLMGMMPPSPKDKIEDISFFDGTLNPSQREAVKFCLESPEVACIHGPPGTGKVDYPTTYFFFFYLPKRILVCGASNLSVDNILERLLALPVSDKSPRLKVTRIGHPARVMTHQGILDSTLDLKAARTDQAALVKDVKSELETTLGMLSGKGKGVKGKVKGAERKKLWEEVKALRKDLRSRELIKHPLHSQFTRIPQVCWIPIFKAKRLILAGDPMQLPPTVLSLDKRKNQQKKGATTPKSQVKNTNMKPQGKLAKNSEPNNPPQSHFGEEGKSSSGGSDDGAKSFESGTENESSGNRSDNNEIVVKTHKPRSSTPVLRPSRTLETTLFDRLESMYGPDIKRMLNVQYRMHKQICTFPSQTLYSKKLTSHSSVAEHLLLDLPGTQGDPTLRKAVDDEETRKEILGTPVTFFDTAGCEYFERLDGERDNDEGSRCNENEATVVKKWVEGLVEAGVGPEHIAIITPYQAQVTLLTSLLRPLYGTLLEIGTVDGMQGREKDAVVISLVRSNDQVLAMTRAKRHLCVVGDSSTVMHGGSYLKKWLQWLDENADVRYAGID